MRPYSIDVAQDESGKLTALGTIDGITDKDGNPQLAGVSGAVKTVNGQPQAGIKGSFTGTRDGISTTVSGSAAVPVDVVDLGDGTNGVRGTGSYRSQVGGVPFSGRNLPIALAAPPGAVDNLRQDWSFHLDLSRRQVGTRPRTVASAVLTLPNGDSIQFKERVARHSPSKGYTLSFSKGTNVTANPVRLDRKSSVVVQGLTFVPDGDTWRPTGGTVLYKFFGQRGTASLMDFNRE